MYNIPIFKTRHIHVISGMINKSMKIQHLLKLMIIMTFLLQLILCPLQLTTKIVKTKILTSFVLRPARFILHLNHYNFTCHRANLSSLTQFELVMDHWVTTSWYISMRTLQRLWNSHIGITLTWELRDVVSMLQLQETRDQILNS